MDEYNAKPLDLVCNPTYTFYELFINGKSPFRDFIDDIAKGSRDEKTLKKIISYMDTLSPSLMLPKTKFRQIKGTGRNDLFEFKKDDMRIYVAMKLPSVFVVLGGYKGNQDADIKRLKMLLKGFNL